MFVKQKPQILTKAIKQRNYNIKYPIKRELRLRVTANGFCKPQIIIWCYDALFQGCYIFSEAFVSSKRWCGYF